MPEKPKKDLLRGILRVFEPSEQPVSDPQNHLLVLLNKPLERVTGVARNGRQYRLSDCHFTRQYVRGGQFVDTDR